MIRNIYSLLFLIFFFYVNVIVILKFILNINVPFKYYEAFYYFIIIFFAIGNFENLKFKNDPKITILNDNKISNFTDEFLTFLIYLTLVYLILITVQGNWLEKVSSSNFDGLKDIYKFKSVLFLFPLLSMIYFILKWK